MTNSIINFANNKKAISIKIAPYINDNLKEEDVITIKRNLREQGFKQANDSLKIMLPSEIARLDLSQDMEDIENMDIIPSHIDLAAAEVERMNLSNREYILKGLFEKVEQEYDFILIDCPPSLGLITVNALTASHSVIIPVQCEYFALEGISKLLNTIRLIKKKLNPELQIEGFLLTMYDGRLRLANQIYDEMKRHFQELVFKTVIQRNVKLSEAPSHGLPAILYDAESKGALNYLKLAKDILKK